MFSLVRIASGPTLSHAGPTPSPRYSSPGLAALSTPSVAIRIPRRRRLVCLPRRLLRSLRPRTSPPPPPSTSIGPALSTSGAIGVSSQFSTLASSAVFLPCMASGGVAAGGAVRRICPTQAPAGGGTASGSARRNPQVRFDIMTSSYVSLEDQEEYKMMGTMVFSSEEEGYRELKHFERTDQKREPRALTRCGCLAKLEIERNEEKRVWFVKEFDNQHTHELANPDHVAFLGVHRVMSDSKKAQAVELRMSGLRPFQIMEVMENNHDESGEVGFVMKDLYNFFTRYEMKNIKFCDAEDVLQYLTRKQEENPQFFFKYTTDEEGRLSNVFWADAESRLDYAAFGGGVIFDSTYRVNKLCTWYIEENMSRHLRKPKLDELRKLIYESMDEEEFERRWADFKENGGTGNGQWIALMYRLREKWAAAYTDGKYLLGMRSNQCSESLNSKLHTLMKRNMSLMCLVKHVKLCIQRLRKKEAQLDIKSTNSVPFCRIDTDPLEKDAARIYTTVMFKKVRAQIRLIAGLEVISGTNQDGSSLYVVGLKDDNEVWDEVRVTFKGQALKGVECHCRKMECEDIPCSHIFVVLKFLGFDTIPHFCVVDRWTMGAKATFRSDRNTDPNVWSEHMVRYCSLRNLGNDAFFEAARNPEQTEKVMDFLKGFLDKGSSSHENIVAGDFGPMPTHFSSSN
uniref:Transposase n=2 Tax=Oryza sativa subsp. japonica TaxID=39947 RepID=Q8W5B5_ORYSJ|nr:putative transposase [Oryza sativa Japonica Group]